MGFKRNVHKKNTTQYLVLMFSKFELQSVNFKFTGNSFGILYFKKQFWNPFFFNFSFCNCAELSGLTLLHTEAKKKMYRSNKKFSN